MNEIQQWLINIQARAPNSPVIIGKKGVPEKSRTGTQHLTINFSLLINFQ